LEEGRGRKGLDRFVEQALGVIRESPVAALLDGSADGGVTSISKKTLGELLCDTRTTADNTILFCSLYSWAYAEPREGQGQQRINDGKELSKHINFAEVSPIFLRDSVRVSGLVDSEVLSAAFEEQALLAERMHGISYAAPRFQRAWRSSGTELYTEAKETHGVELSGIQLDSGVHTWVLEVEAMCNWFWVGVAVKSIDTKAWLGKQQGGWAFGNIGVACHATEIDDGPYNCLHPDFYVGDMLALTLDLSSDGVLRCRFAMALPFWSFFR